MQINEEPLRLAMKAIEAEPEGWDQANWFRQGRSWNQTPEFTEVISNVRVLDTEASCGTTMCLAGQLVHQAGWKMVSLVDADGKFLPASTHAVHPETGEVRQIMDVAAEILGVPQYGGMAEGLFYNNSRTVKEFKKHVTELTGVKFD